MVGSAAPPASGGEAIHVSIVAAGPGRQHGSHLRPPEAALPARADRGPRPERAALDRHQLRRPPAERAEHRHGAAADREVDQRRVGVRSGERRRPPARRRHSPARRPGTPTALPGRGPTRSRSPSARSSQAGPVRLSTRPAGQVGVVPVADRPVEVRRERSARAVAVGRPDEDRRAQVVGSVRVVDADDRQPAAVRRERRAGRPAGRARGPRAAPGPSPASPSAASASTAQIDVRGRRSASGLRSAANAIVRPSGCQAMPATPKSPSVSCRASVAPGRRHDEQVRPAVEVAPTRRSASRCGGSRRASGVSPPAAPARRGTAAGPPPP